MPVFGRRAPTPEQLATYIPAPTAMQVLRADGQRIDLTSRDTAVTLAATRQGWQAEAWQYRDMIGELRSAYQLLAHAVAGVRFFPAVTRPYPEEPAELDGDDHGLDGQLVADALHNFARIPFDNEPDGFTARFTENIKIAGELYVQIDAGDRWHVRSTSEVTTSADGRVTIAGLPGAGQAHTHIVDPEAEDLLRCWVPHPEWGQLADSAMRPLLDTCEDVVLAGREQRAAARSRLAANGLLLMPSTLSLVRTRDEDDDHDDSVTSDTFMADLTAAMLAPIRNDADAQAVVPIVIRGEPEDLDKVRHVTMSRADSEQLIERQAAALLRVLRGVDVQPEQVQGTGDMNHWCVDDQTEILTARGWLRGDEVQVGDVALTLNHETGLSEWQPVLDLYRADVVDELMVAMESRRHSSLTTLGHRWPVFRERGGKNRNLAGEWIDGRHLEREWTTSEALTVRDWIPTAARSADQPADAKYTDDLVELVGWFWTEGNIRHGGGRTVSIAQSHTVNAARVNRIRACLTRLYGPAEHLLRGCTGPCWRERVQPNRSSHGGPITVFTLCRHAAEPLVAAAPGKLVSREFVRALTPAQLELFIDVSAQGDGWHYRSGRLDMWQRDLAALEGYELALILSGRMVTRGTSGNGHWVTPHNSSRVNPPKASQEARRHGRGPLVTRERYTGLVWCPTTGNGSWFARRRGTTYFTGNSGWLVAATAIKDQVQPTAKTIAACLAQAFWRPALESLEHDPAQVARLTIAVDVSGLSENPNRGQDARDAYDRSVISAGALREALGFGDDDAPDDDEALRRLATSGALPVGVVATLLGLSQQDVRQAATIEGQIASESAVAPRPALPAGPRPAAPGQVSPEQPTPSPPGPVVAAANLPDVSEGWVVDVELARALADIDAALVERIAVAADAAIARVVERAGARVRNAAGKDAAVFASLRGVDAWLVPSQLGRARVESFVPIADLLADGYARLRGQVTGWIGEAVGRVADTVVRLLRLDPAGRRGGQVRAAVVSRLAGRVDPAWEHLAARLDEAVERTLFAADPLSPEPSPGEGVDTLIRPAEVVEVLSIAGGGVAVDDDPATADRVPGAGGLGTGPVVAAVLADEGAVLLGHEWRYRPELPRRAVFDAHKQLDGVRFATWTDPKLDTDASTAWVGPFFHPQDHLGCRCNSAPIVAVPEDPDGIVAQRMRAARGNPRNVAAGRVAVQDAAAGRVGTSVQNEVEVRDRIAAALAALTAEHIGIDEQGAA